jgi:hypothetical protein
MPRRTAARAVRQRAARIGRTPNQHSQKDISDSFFRPPHHIAIEGILNHDDPERTDRGNDVIDPARRLGSHADVAERRFAERPDLKLRL